MGFELGYFSESPASEDFLIVLSLHDRKILVRHDNFVSKIVTWPELSSESFISAGFFNGQKVWAKLVDHPLSFSECKIMDLREIYDAGTELDFALVARAYHVASFSLDFSFCPKCGGAVKWHKTEAGKHCQSCDHIHYPRINPCVIMVVKNGSKILLARGAKSNKDFWSLLAGYVEAGETLEDAVRREVFEEVGIRLTKLHYEGSQPWPFSQSLMAGFIAETNDIELNIDPKEISEAAWFEINSLPKLAPKPSMIWYLIEKLKTYS